MTHKRIFITITSIAVLLLAVMAFFIGFRINLTSVAKEQLTGEIAAVEHKTDDTKKSNEEINSQISDLDAELSTKDTMNNYYMEYQKQHDRLTEDIRALKEESASLDSQIEDTQGNLERNSGVKSGTKGKRYSVKKDEIYTCPDKLPQGRYIITGGGTVVIYSSSGRVRATENLDVAYGNSYTFDLNENEQIKVSQNATLTELK